MRERLLDACVPRHLQLAGEGEFVELVFEPQPEGTMADVLIYLVDEHNEYTDCVCVRAVYLPPPL